MKPTLAPALHARLRPEDLMERAQAALSDGLPETASEMFQRLEADPAVAPVRRFIALLGHAQAMALRGDKGLALDMLRQGLDLGEIVPEPWRRAALEFQDLLAQPGTSSAILPAMDEIVNLEAAEPSQIEAANLRLDVDTTHYVMRLLRDGQVVASYPIGLGRGGSTPLGTFRIANKISDPDWFDRGNVVPAGSPDNPLGKSWMGLGRDGKATPYGIHPTAESESIGRSDSRGCIRMWPEDAAALFRICPIGTPVLIHS